MRRLGVFVLPAIAALVVAASSAGNQPYAWIALHGSSPVVVDGAHFHRGERVRLTASTGASVSVRANSRGAFSVTLGRVPVDRCSGLIVRARGSAGSLAVARRPPLPQCLPARGQGNAA